MEITLAHNLRQEPGTDFPTGLAVPAQQTLAGASFMRLEQLTTVEEAELLRLHVMRPKALGLLRAVLEARGLSFADASGGPA